RSDRFHQLGRKTRSLLASLPYAESLYAFPSMVGQVFCMEQLYASKYTISVSRALVHLVMQVSGRRLMACAKKRIVSCVRKCSGTDTGRARPHSARERGVV